MLGRKKPKWYKKGAERYNRGAQGMKCYIASGESLESEGIFRGVLVARFIGSLRLLESHSRYLFLGVYYMRAEGWPSERVSQHRGSISHCVDLN